MKKLRSAFRNIESHALRSFLTILGIVFGVSSVVAMLSISEGARKAAIEKIRGLGTNNIIVNSVKPAETSLSDNQQRSWTPPKYGIKTTDYEHIKNSFFDIYCVIPAKEMRLNIYDYKNKYTDTKVIAIIPDYIIATNQRVQDGRFISNEDIANNKKVCVLQNDAKRALFSYKDPIEKFIQIKDKWYQVVGVLENRGNDVYIPFSTAISDFGNVSEIRSSGKYERMQIDIDKMIITVRNIENITDTANRVRRYFSKTHEKQDYEIIVPDELLKQEEATQKIFKIVMSSIAGISLVVGGIGIMNIMLANIKERTKEIGTRRALGARKKDILAQFLIESVLLTNFGGIIGVFFGISLSYGITKYVVWPTIITPISIIVAFVLSTVVGIIFGTYPAYQAARLNPIEALRSE